MTNKNEIKCGTPKEVTVELSKEELLIISSCLRSQVTRMKTPKGNVKKKYDENKVEKALTLSRIFEHLGNML